MQACLGHSKVEADHLNQVNKNLEGKLSLGSKGLVEACQKLVDSKARDKRMALNFEAQEKRAAQEAVETCKPFEDCKNEMLAFSEQAFLKGMEDT